MTFTELKYFVETYQQKSIVKAAENLYVVPSVVSAAIKRLEGEFEIPLFHRSANRLTPTLAGDQFYQDALEILMKAASLKQNMLQHRADALVAQRYMIGMSESLNMQYGDKILDALSLVFPNVVFSIFDITNRSDTFYQEFDITIDRFSPKMAQRYLTDLPKKYSAKSLIETPMFAWISKNSPLNNYKTLTFELLNEYKFIILKSSGNVLDSLNFASNFTGGKHNPLINSEKDFVRYLETPEYFTIDILEDGGDLILKHRLTDKNVVLKNLKEKASVYMFYHNETTSDFIPVIADVFTKNRTTS